MKSSNISKFLSGEIQASRTICCGAFLELRLNFLMKKESFLAMSPRPLPNFIYCFYAARNEFSRKKRAMNSIGGVRTRRLLLSLLSA